MQRWFISRYAIDRSDRNPSLALDIYSNPAFLSGLAKGSESEVGNAGFAVVLVDADQALLDELSVIYYGFPQIALTATINSSGINSAKKQELWSKLVELGFNDTDITARLGANIGNRTLREVLDFCTRYRVVPSYVSASQSFVYDGVTVPALDVDSVLDQISRL
jgi:hypothetical protein